MKYEAVKVCAVCNGSGVAIKASDYPGFEDRRWCQSCEVGRAKAEKVAEIVARSMSERKVRAA